ncbi:MAG: hypothetical protein J4F31_04720 [Flavobacteriales bacterium]|nr:hypothetical protein [Flavobacteriales bacterium]
MAHPVLRIKITTLLVLLGLTALAQPYKAGLERFLGDVRAGGNGIAAEFSNEINALSGGSARTAEITQFPVYFQRGSEALVGLLFARVLATMWPVCGSRTGTIRGMSRP